MTEREKAQKPEDLTRLFVGSEGTLGIATRITLRIVRTPQAIRTLLEIGRAHV